MPPLQVVIADDRQAGYFLHIWRRLSWPHPLRILRHQPFPDNTCFSKAILAPYAAHAQSLLTYKAGSVDEVLCESVVLQATSRWLRHLFRDLLPLSQRTGRPASARRPKPASTQPGKAGGYGAAAAAPRDDDSISSGSGSGGFSSQHGRLPGLLRELAPLEPSPTQSAAPLELLHVVWLSRHRFEQQHLSELTDWQKARVLSQQQQEELVLALQRAVLQWNAHTCVTAEQKDCQSRHVMFSLQVGGMACRAACAGRRLWMELRAPAVLCKPDLDVTASSEATARRARHGLRLSASLHLLLALLSSAACCPTGC